MEEQNLELNEKEKNMKEIADMIFGLTKAIANLNKKRDNILLVVLKSSIKAQLFIDLENSRPSGFEISLGFKDFYMGLFYDRGACRMRTTMSSVIEEKEIQKEICETLFDYFRRHRKLTEEDFS